MSCLEWRLESHSVQFSQFRNITRQIHQILQNLTQPHTICLRFVGYWPQLRVLSRNMTGIKSIGRYQHVRYSAHKINRYYFSSASASASMNSVKTVSQLMPCWFFLWDLSCAKHREQGAIMGAPQHVVSWVIFHATCIAFTNMLRGVLKHSNCNRKPLPFWIKK